MIIADIPALFTITFRVIGQIGSVFEYDMNSIEEKQFIFEILDLGSGIATAEKVRQMLGKEALKNYVKKVAFVKMEQIAAVKLGQKGAQEIAVEILHKQGKRATQKSLNTNDGKS